MTLHVRRWLSESISLLILILLVGCGGGGSTPSAGSPASESGTAGVAATPAVALPTPAPTATDGGPTLTADPGHLFGAQTSVPGVSLLDMAGRTVRPGVAAKSASALPLAAVAEVAVGIVLEVADGIAAEEDVAYVKDSLDSVQSTLAQVQDQVGRIATAQQLTLERISVMQAETTAYTTVSSVQIRLSRIEGYWSMFVRQVPRTAPSPTAMPSPVPWPPIPNTPGWVAYQTQYDWAVESTVNEIHGQICPDAGPLKGVLMDYANLLVRKNRGIAATRPERVIDCYTALEQYYCLLLARQAQGAVMVVNSMNYFERVKLVNGAPPPDAKSVHYIEQLQAKIARQNDAFQVAARSLVLGLHPLEDQGTFLRDLGWLGGHPGAAWVPGWTSWPVPGRADSLTETLARIAFVAMQVDEKVGRAPQSGLRGLVVQTADLPEPGIGTLEAGYTDVQGKWRTIRPSAVTRFTVSGPRYFVWDSGRTFDISHDWRCFEVEFGNPADVPVGGRVDVYADGKLVGGATYARYDAQYNQAETSDAVPFAYFASSNRWGPRDFAYDGRRWELDCRWKVWPATWLLAELSSNPSFDHGQTDTTRFTWDRTRPLRFYFRVVSWFLYTHNWSLQLAVKSLVDYKGPGRREAHVWYVPQRGSDTLLSEWSLAGHVLRATGGIRHAGSETWLLKLFEASTNAYTRIAGGYYYDTDPDTVTCPRVNGREVTLALEAAQGYEIWMGMMVSASNGAANTWGVYKPSETGVMQWKAFQLVPVDGDD